MTNCNTIRKAARSLFHFIFLFIFTPAVTAQEADNSKEKVIAALASAGNTCDDTACINRLQLQASELIERPHDSVIRLLKLTEKESLRLGYNKGVANALFLLGKLYLLQNNYDDCINTLHKAIPYANRSDAKLLVKIHTNIANAYLARGAYGKAGENLYQAMEVMEKNNITDPLMRVVVYGNLSYIWREVDIRDSSVLLYMKHAEQMLAGSSDPGIIAYLLANKALSHFDAGKYDSSLHHYLDAYKYVQLAPRKEPQELFIINQLELEICNQIGKTYVLLNRASLALPYLRNAISLAEKHNNIFQLIVAQESTGSAFYQLGNYTHAAEALETAVKLGKESGFVNGVMVSAHTMLTDIYRSRGLFLPALEHQQAAVLMKDSLLNKEKIQVISRLETRRRVAEKDKEIAEKQLQIAQRDNRIQKKNMAITGIAAGALLLAVLLVVVYRNHRHKQRLSQREAEVMSLQAAIKAEERERARVARELHDGILSQLSSIKIKLGFIGDRNTNMKEQQEFGKALEQFDDALADLRSAAHNMMPEILQQGLAPAVADTCRRITGNTPLKAEFQLISPLPALPEEFELSVYRIIQELLQNTLKHAKATTVLVQLGYHDGSFNVTVEDNGIGFDKTAIGKGMGLNNLRMRVEELKGYLDITTEKGTGTSISIEFPVYNATG